MGQDKRTIVFHAKYDTSYWLFYAANFGNISENMPLNVFLQEPVLNNRWMFMLKRDWCATESCKRTVHWCPKIWDGFSHSWIRATFACKLSNWVAFLAKFSNRPNTKASANFIINRLNASGFRVKNGNMSVVGLLEPELTKTSIAEERWPVLLE